MTGDSRVESPLEFTFFFSSSSVERNMFVLGDDALYSKYLSRGRSKSIQECS